MSLGSLWGRCAAFFCGAPESERSRGERGSGDEVLGRVLRIGRVRWTARIERAGGWVCDGSSKRIRNIIGE